LFGQLAFEPRLLYHCNQQDGRQQHFSEIYRALLKDNRRTVTADNSEIRTSLKRESDFNFDWTDVKIKMWVRLCNQLGLITTSDESPNYDSVEVEHGEFRRALDWINDNLFAVYQERAGTPQLHPAIADVLRNMEADGVISLSSPGDAQNSVKVPPENLDNDVRGERRDVTRISVYSRPDETAYEYPLTQFLTQQ